MGQLMTDAHLLNGKPNMVPTPLLHHIAGGFAAKVANIWPAPHAGFLTLPTARRHLAAILIDAVDPVTAAECAELVDLVTFARDDEAAGWISNCGSVSIMKMLSRFGEVLWTPESYRAFTSICVRHGASKMLAHMSAFDPACVAVIAKLPDAMLRPKIIGAIPHAKCAEDLCEAVQIIKYHHGDGAIDPLAQAMVQSKSPWAMMDKVRDALLPNVFGAAFGVPVLPAQFTPVRDRKQLKATALAFKNCLRDYTHEMACGQLAVFVVHGSPDVVLAIARDAYGWFLDEAKIKGNEDVPRDLLIDLVRALRAGGIRVGMRLEVLGNRLHGHVCKTCYVPEPWPNWREALGNAY